ncbi:uncharacterized protein LOC129592480 [Paramacrobiotus metropolitanus]|uniref:uncharacterized protein LOC129592480 n=1 Tax=Paramacrobiotus metropolitanus TaxID=2943436 RepID=UPI00244561AC|nr:uncharacterized protein LOC129592480 [Paramacrobiotus metropolitanus]
MSGLLQAKGIRLPLIVIKNTCAFGSLSWSLLITVGRNERAGTFDCSWSKEFFHGCEKIIVCNFPAWPVIATAAMEIMLRDATLPAAEKAFLRDTKLFRQELKTDVIVPSVRFRSSDSPLDRWRCLLTAANATCTHVSQRIKDKVTSMHSRWVQMLAYPDEWTSIRILLRLFETFRPTDNPKRWDTMDLRQLDICACSQVTLKALDGCYKD